MTLAQRGGYEESIETFKQVVDPGDAYCQVAAVMKLNGKREDALRAYQEVLKTDPGNQRAAHGIGVDVSSRSVFGDGAADDAVQDREARRSGAGAGAAASCLGRNWPAGDAASDPAAAAGFRSGRGQCPRLGNIGAEEIGLVLFGLEYRL